MKKNAFTLIELSIVLVIVGLILGGSVKIFTSMRDRAKITSAKQDVQSATNTIVGYAISSGFLPTTATFDANLTPVKGNEHPLLYKHDNLMDTNNICSLPLTVLTVRVHDYLGNIKDIPNIAFVTVSASANRNMQTILSGTAPNQIVELKKPYDLVDDEPSPINRVEEYDDVASWMTLSELQKEVGCVNRPFRFLNTSLPSTEDNATEYTAELYVENNRTAVTIDCTPANDHNITFTFDIATAKATFAKTAGQVISHGTSLRDCTATETGLNPRVISKKYVITINN